MSIPHGSNNFLYHQGCPALMDDGRFGTFYGSTNDLTNSIQRINGFRNSNAFRRFMQQNAEELKRQEREFFMKNNYCSSNFGCSEGYITLWNKLDGNWANFRNN